jgi:peptidoglycan/LPS O-acetylase OafA/YrhL
LPKRGDTHSTRTRLQTDAPHPNAAVTPQQRSDNALATQIGCIPHRLNATHSGLLSGGSMQYGVPHPSARNTSLDGLRGIGIALVVMYHAYVRWPELVPYGDRFARLPFVSQGRVGVCLLFLLSGFVIFMTLERSSGFLNFMRRRWLRLWPAMFVVSIVIYATAWMFTRPAGQPTLRDLLPGLSLIEPSAWAWLLGSPQGVLEGAFWTLFVEMKFYVVASALYFTVGARATFALLIGMFLAPSVAGRFPQFIPGTLALSNILDSWFWGWFMAGALYFKAMRTRWLFVPALALSLFSAHKMGAENAGVAYSVALLFGATLVSRHVQAFLSLRPFLFLGAISYPLYLVHENMMVSMIGTVGRIAPWMPHVLMPVLPMVVVGTIAWVIAIHVEPVVRNAVRWPRNSPALRVT